MNDRDTGAEAAVDVTIAYDLFQAAGPLALAPAMGGRVADKGDDLGSKF